METETYATLLKSLIGIKMQISRMENILVLYKRKKLLTNNPRFTIGEISHVGYDYVKILSFQYEEKHHTVEGHRAIIQEEVLHISKVKFIDRTIDKPNTSNKYPSKINPSEYEF